MTDAERRPMQRMIAKGLDSHVRGMGGRRRAEALSFQNSTRVRVQQRDQFHGG